MLESNNQILKRIKFIRKSKRFSVHDCASILGISKEAYLNIENGTQPITLPELELLALYFCEAPSVIIFADQMPNKSLAFLDENLSLHYKRIREKMLRAQIIQAREKLALTLTDVQKATHISIETLTSYDEGTSLMPIDDLIKITCFLGIPSEALHEPLWTSQPDLESETAGDNWHPEYQSPDSLVQLDDQDAYIDILDAFGRIPKEDQAYIVKYLIEKLRAM